MLVRDIGVFPSWMSFPYRSEHIKRLTINIRIVQPGTSTIPDEWIEAARYEDVEYRPTHWHMLMAIVFYALGCFSVKKKPELPCIRRDTKPAAAENTTAPALKLANNTRAGSNAKHTQVPFRSKQKKSSNMRPNLVDHHSDVFDAYRLPFASYAVDELVLDFTEPEHDVKNKPMMPLVRNLAQKYKPWDPVLPDGLESIEDGRFYKKGCCQFSRDVFPNYSFEEKNTEWIIDDLSLMDRGVYSVSELHRMMVDIISGVAMPSVCDSPYAPYLQVLAHSVGSVWDSGPTSPLSSFMDMPPLNWTYYDSRWNSAAQDGEWQYSDQVLARNLARELAREPPDEEHILRLRILQSRKAHGWIKDDD